LIADVAQGRTTEEKAQVFMENVIYLDAEGSGQTESQS
jgi:hypothetical protein